MCSSYQLSGSKHSKLWKSKRFNEMRVLGEGEIPGCRCECCVQLVFSMFVFSPMNGFIVGFSWIPSRWL